MRLCATDLSFSVLGVDGTANPRLRDMHCIDADYHYQSDAALHGPLVERHSSFPSAIFSSGFDPGGQSPANPRIRDRHVSRTFREDSKQAMAWKAPWLLIKTFNFSEEGIDIAEPQKFGRKFLDWAHEYTARFEVAFAQPADRQ